MAGSLVNHAGDAPYFKTIGGTDYKRLYRSKRDHALTLEVSLLPGYGVLPQGLPLAKVTGGNRAGYFVPYNPNPNQASADPATWHGGRAYLLANSDDGAAAHSLDVTIEDSYKFAVGDVIGIDSDGGSPYQLTITAIDRTTYRNKAVITCTGTITAAHTVANGAHLFVDGENANTFSKCVGLLEAAVDTGVGENAAGGQGIRIIGHAILFSGMLDNVDTACVTDLSASTDGQYLIIK